MKWDSIIPETNVFHHFTRVTRGAFSSFRGAISAALQEAYANGFQGVFVDHEEAPSWAQNIARYERNRVMDILPLGRKRVSEVMPTALQGSGRGKRALNFAYTMKIRADYFAGNQDYGNCRAWCGREATGTLAGMAVAAGDIKRFDHRHGTAVMYGERQSSGQGMTMERGIEILLTIGQGEEKDYTDLGIDLSTETKDEDAGNNWGRTGIPAKLKDAVTAERITKGYHVDSPTVDMLCDILYSEGVVEHGSTRTAAKSTNGLVSGLTTIGGHAQLCFGYDDTDEMRSWVKQNCGLDLKGEALFINDQSWGDWMDLPNWPTELWGPRPEGAWVVTGSDMLRLCKEWNDAWAQVGLNGFVARRLPDWASWTYL